MNEINLENYAQRFARLRTDKSRSRWSASTCYQAPHKPLLLLCVLDLFEQGEIGSNLIELSPDVGELFTRYWQRLSTFDRHGNLALPFFHLRSEEFWQLLPKLGKEEALRSASQIRSLSKLQEHVMGARLDHDLYELLHEQEARTRLRSVLLATYFAPEIGNSLFEQGVVNRGAFLYSEELLNRSQDQAVEEALPEEEEYRPAVRDQGFRRAVVIAYAHRCALCGIRVRTLNGRTAVAAAHIVPWSETHDDRPANGMALCRTCHWTFDEGLLSVSHAYNILASSQLMLTDNMPGYLISLEGQELFRPAERAYWPDPDSMRWHRSEVFLRG